MEITSDYTAAPPPPPAPEPPKAPPLFSRVMWVGIVGMFAMGGLFTLAGSAEENYSPTQGTIADIVGYERITAGRDRDVRYDYQVSFSVEEAEQVAVLSSTAELVVGEPVGLDVADGSVAFSTGSTGSGYKAVGLMLMGLVAVIVAAAVVARRRRGQTRRELPASVVDLIERIWPSRLEFVAAVFIAMLALFGIEEASYLLRGDSRTAEVVSSEAISPRAVKVVVQEQSGELHVVEVSYIAFSDSGGSVQIYGRGDDVVARGAHRPIALWQVLAALLVPIAAISGSRRFRSLRSER